MTRRRQSRGVPVLALFVAFGAGMVVEWGLQHYGPPQPARVSAEPLAEHPPSVTPIGPVASTPPAAAVHEPVSTTGTVSAPPLRMPLDDVSVEAMKGGFQERRGSRPHEAADLLAPRNTPVHAVENGTIAKLFTSKAGGLTIYQFDPSKQLCYYYAHLERYADALQEGQAVSKGQVIGYVGTSGNAPPNTPHLHFAVFELNADHQWWKGRAIDPYPLFKARSNS